MLGDVTFQLLSRIGIRTIQTLSEMPAEVLQQMIGKNGIEQIIDIQLNDAEKALFVKSAEGVRAMNDDLKNVL